MAQAQYSGSLQQLVHDANHFAFDLFSQIATKSTGNLFFSPSSVATAMAMAYAGARGETADEMACAMRFSLPNDQLHEAFRELAAVTRTGGVEFHSANRLWGQRGYHFLDQFVEITERCYGARMAEVDFGNDVEATRLEINRWVEETTHDRIKEPIRDSSLDSMSRLVLASVVYFLGTWESPFEEGDTHESDFFGAGGRISKTPMMEQTEWFSYSESDSFKVLEMPYRAYSTETQTVQPRGETYQQPYPVDEEGSDFALTVILPQSRDGLAMVATELAGKGMNGLPAFERREVHVCIPKSMSKKCYLASFIEDVSYGA